MYIDPSTPSGFYYGFFPNFFYHSVGGIGVTDVKSLDSLSETTIARVSAARCSLTSTCRWPLKPGECVFLQVQREPVQGLARR